MIPLRSRYVLAVQDDAGPTLLLNPLRRLLFAAVTVVLVAAALLGGSGDALSPGSPGLVGSLVYLALVLICASVAARGRLYRFDRAAGEFVTQSSILGLPIARRRRPLSDLTRVRVVGFTMARNRLYYRLELTISAGGSDNQKALRIEDGTTGIREQGFALAHATGLPYLYEQQ